MRTNRILSVVTKEKIQQYREAKHGNNEIQYTSGRKSFLDFIFRRKAKIFPVVSYNKSFDLTDITDVKTSPDPTVYNLRQVKSNPDLLALSNRSSRCYEEHILECYKDLLKNPRLLPGFVDDTQE